MRKDRFGNEIRIGKKKHSISFRDQVEKGSNLAEIIEVESYKRYNLLDENEGGTTFCKCVIF